MKDKSIGIYILFVFFILLIFGLIIMLNDLEEIKITDYLLLCVVLLIMFFSFYLNTLIGLILSMVVVFIMGSVVLYYEIINIEIQISNKYYIWLIIIPASAFITGKMGEYYRNSIKEIDKLKDQVDELVTIDAVTQLENSKQFYIDLDQEISRAKRYKNHLTLMIIEIQYFDELLAMYRKKEIEKFIKDVSDFIKRAIRLEDERYRIGKNLFAIILPNTDEEGAKSTKERIKNDLKLLNIKNEKVRCEFKIGVLEYSDVIKNSLEYKKMTMRKIEYDI